MERKLELAIDEGLSNAIYHANLEVPSTIKTEDFDKFYQIAGPDDLSHFIPVVLCRCTTPYTKGNLRVIIKDDGNWFDWQKLKSDTGTDPDLLHGRGLMIVRALTTSMEFNEAGNELTMVFDFAQLG